MLPIEGRLIGVGVLAFGAGGAAMGWYALLATKGVLVPQAAKMLEFGPVLVAAGASMLAAPRQWFAPDGRLRLPWGLPLLATVGLGLLLVAGSVLLSEHFQRRWEAARRSHRACGEELVRLSAEFTEALAGVRDQASARKAEEKLRGLARWGRQLHEWAESQRDPTREDKEWMAEVMFPALEESGRKRGEGPRAITTPEVDRLVTEINSAITRTWAELGVEIFGEELEASMKRKSKP
jgi:hypothetical protein